MRKESKAERQRDDKGKSETEKRNKRNDKCKDKK